MRAIDPARFLGVKSEGAGECIYACAHKVGKHNVISTINFTNNGIEVKCVEPRRHETWRVSMGLAHTAAILFKLTHNDIETAATVWDFLAKSPKLDEDLDKLVIDTRHIIHFPTQVSSEAVNAYIVYEAEKINDACPTESWNVLFLSEMKAPFDLEIAIRKHPLHSYRYICRVESKDLKDLFVECCIGRKEEEDERSSTSLNRYNGKYTICTNDVKSIFKRLLDELLYYEEWDKFVIKRIELENIRTFAAKNIGAKQNQLISKTCNDDEIASWLRSTVAEATKTLGMPTSDVDNGSKTMAMTEQDALVPTEAEPGKVLPQETITNAAAETNDDVTDTAAAHNSSIEIFERTALDASEHSIYVQALMNEEADPMVDVSMASINASSDSLMLQQTLPDNTDAENIDAENMDHGPGNDIVPRDVFEGIDRDNDDGVGCGVFSGYDVLLQALSRHDVHARTKEETDAVLTMLSSWSCFRKHIADGSSSSAAAVAASSNMLGDSKAAAASYRHQLPVEDLNAIAAACRSTVQVILSSEPALTAPVVRAGESVRDAFIILKGHLLVTATTTSAVATTCINASSDAEGVAEGVGVGVTESQRPPDDPFGIEPTPDDDEMGQGSSHGDHTSAFASCNTASAAHVNNNVEEKMRGSAEEKLTITETATLLCGPGTFLGSQLFAGVSRWGVEIKAVDFATIHAALAVQQQQQQQQQQQMGTKLNGEINAAIGAINPATPVASLQPDNNNNNNNNNINSHNNNNNNNKTNEKFVSAPSVVLCRIPAEVLLHHKGYTNAKVRTDMDLFWRYVCQRAVSSGISPIDGIEPSVESAVAVPVVAAVSVAATATVVEDRRGSTKSVVSVPNSESGQPPNQLTTISLADLAWVRVVPRGQAVFRSGEPRRFLHAIVQGECALQRACPRTHAQTQRRNHLKHTMDRRLRDGGIRSDSLVVPMVDGEGFEYTIHAIDEIDTDPMQGPDGIITVDFGSAFLSGDFCCVDGETMKLVAIKEKAMKKVPEYLRALYHRQMWLRQGGPGARAAITAASATADGKHRRRRAMELELLRPVYGLLNEQQPTALFGTHQHTLLAKTQSLVLTLPLLDLAGLDESLFYTLLHVVAQAYPKLEHPEQQRDDDWVLFHDQQRIWSLEKRLSLQDHFHGKSCRGLGLVGLNDAACAVHGSNVPSPRGYLVKSHLHQSHHSQQQHRKKKEKEVDTPGVDKESLDETVETASEEERVARGGEEEEGEEGEDGGGVAAPSITAASHPVDRNDQEEGEGEVEERTNSRDDSHGEEENKEQPHLPQQPPQDDSDQVVRPPTKPADHVGTASRRSPKKRVPMFSKPLKQSGDRDKDRVDGTGGGADSCNASNREYDDHDNPYNLRAGYLISQLIDRVNQGEQLDQTNIFNNHNNNNNNNNQKR